MKIICKAGLVKLFVLVCFTVIYLVSNDANSQTLFGLNFDNANDTAGFIYNNSLDAAGTDVYVKIDPGLFDRILLHKGLGFDCTVNFPNASRFREIYYEIVKFCGYENEIKDVFGEDAKFNGESDDFTSLTFLVFDGKAEIVRLWYEEKYNLKLEFSKNKFNIFILIL